MVFNRKSKPMSPHDAPKQPKYYSGVRPGISDSDRIAPDCAGLNFFEIDHQFQSLLPLYLTQDELNHFTPHFDAMGEVAGGRLNVVDGAGPRCTSTFRGTSPRFRLRIYRRLD